MLLTVLMDPMKTRHALSSVIDMDTEVRTSLAQSYLRPNIPLRRRILTNGSLRSLVYRALWGSEEKILHSLPGSLSHALK